MAEPTVSPEATGNPIKGNGAEASAAAPGTASEKARAATGATTVRKGKGVRAGNVQPEESTLQEADSYVAWMKHFLRESPSWLVSMFVHMIMILVLAFWTISLEKQTTATQFVITKDAAEEIQDLDETLEDAPEDLNVDITTELASSELNITTDAVVLGEAEDLDAAPASIILSDFGLERAPKTDLLSKIGTFSGTGLTGRGSAIRGALVRQGGGTPGSENAVALALQWLARHQMPDGGWSFNHTAAPKCNNQCRNPGNLAYARNAATSLALLPFLGAGQTHREGKYKPVVKSGLYFLINRMRVGPNGGALNESGSAGMYSHGLASIVLCEAYAMTRDKGLQSPAQEALNFICYAQDPVAGGWRYRPRQRGDTSVVGWQIMALKSGHMAYLKVPTITVKKAYEYLDTVQTNSGANYGYTEPVTGSATTAIGLLCRMYLGWKKDNPALERGVAWLSKKGPSESNMYYNYYATQVMRHWEGELWKKWNVEMRDYLVHTQAKRGHEEGSWFIRGDLGPEQGGRLYITAMAAMILEVYYRHMPIYRSKSTEEDFPM